MTKEIKERVFDLILSVLKESKEVSYPDGLSLPHGGLFLVTSTKIAIKDMDEIEQNLFFTECAKRFVDGNQERIGLQCVYFERPQNKDIQLFSGFVETIIYIY